MTGCHPDVIMSIENVGMDREKSYEIASAITTGRIGKVIRWVTTLPAAVETIRAARTPAGRTVKTLLFGVAMAVPFGIFLVALLFWHGARVNGRSLHPVAA